MASKIIEIILKVVFNTGSALLDPISQSLQKFGDKIGGELFLPKPQTGKSFYEDSDKPCIPSGLAFYSTSIASSYNHLVETGGARKLKRDCPLQLYIEEEVDTLYGDDREQPTCWCYPENHLHVFRLPFIYFLIDGVEKGNRHQDIIEILRTLKNHKIYTHSTKKNRGRKNLADKLIELSRKEFKDDETLRSVSTLFQINYLHKEIFHLREVFRVTDKRLRNRFKVSKS